MNIKKLLVARGIHYFITRYGWRSLRQAAFDEKYRNGEWRFSSDSKGELPRVIEHYLGGGNLLIMGCGGCAVLEGINPRKLNSALGIDISPEALRLAEQYQAENVRFVLADMETYSAAIRYDIILFSESLYYVPIPRCSSFLKRLKNALNDNGVIVATFADAARYSDLLALVRTGFTVLEDRPFTESRRHLMVFK